MSDGREQQRCKHGTAQAARCCWHTLPYSTACAALVCGVLRESAACVTPCTACEVRSNPQAMRGLMYAVPCPVSNSAARRSRSTTTATCSKRWPSTRAASRRRHCPTNRPQPVRWRADCRRSSRLGLACRRSYRRRSQTVSTAFGTSAAGRAGPHETPLHRHNCMRTHVACMYCIHKYVLVSTW